MVRAKFTVTEIHNLLWSGTKVVLSPVYDTSIPEDARFQKSTPTGRFEMQIDNPQAIEQFTLGASYYVDFTPAPKAPPG